MQKKVLMVGLHPSIVDYSKYPGLTADRLEAALQADKDALKAEGFDASVGFVHSLETAADQLEEILKGDRYDVVMIGAGVRKDDDHFLVFERLVNVIHEFAPGSRIAFNTGPTDSRAAVMRWA
ncbi:MAG: hypothetical protein AAGB18_00870 [Pseudomonadota bacterium]